MTNIEFFIDKSGYFLGFQARGHSGNGISGNDIVCSAISSAMFLVANTITEVFKIDAKIHIDDAKLSVILPDSRILNCQELLEGLKLHLLSLEEQYPNNISVNYTEV